MVVVSWPPAAMLLARKPSKSKGRRAARAAYTAAVCAAGPEPMITTGTSIGLLFLAADAWLLLLKPERKRRK